MLQLVSFCLTIIANIHRPLLLLPLWQQGLVALFVFVPLVLLVYLQPKARVTVLMLVAGLVAGLVYSHGFAMYRINSVLPQEYEQQDIKLQVAIDSLVQDKKRYSQSRVRVLSSQEPQLDALILNWYGKIRPQPCQRWQLTVRLKRPHGLANPGGFDYQLYLLEQGIQGKGYVREAQLLDAEQSCLHGFRQRWHDYVNSRLTLTQASWVIALSTGDKSQMSDEQYRLLQINGINHLFVISGLHIGLAASAVYLLVLGMRRMGGGLLLPVDWRPAAIVLALMAATAYAALAGFTIPAQRALLMLLAFFGGQLLGIVQSLWQRYWQAMAVVLLFNPLSAGNIGFALSFAAVAILLLLAQSVRRETLGRWQSLYLLWQLQLAIAIGLSPLLLLYFQQASILAPFINLFAIPAVSIVIVPGILLALLLWMLTGAADFLLSLLDFAIHCLFQLIAIINRPFSGVLDTVPTMIMDGPRIALWAVIVLLLLMPRMLPARLPFATLLLAVMLLSPPQPPVRQGELVMHVMDVGQGTALLLQTAGHNLLYDTGASWPGGSMADFAVLPLLQHLAVRDLDKLVISHYHNDHDGGLERIKAALPVKQWLGPSNRDQLEPDQYCRAGQSWQWDGIDFTLLHPEAIEGYRLENDRSCVLKLKVAGRTVLIPGDVERQGEFAMLNYARQQGVLQQVDVLLAPHHGSRSSSTLVLTERAEKAVVIVSAGYLNRFGHPHRQVLRRYTERRTRLFNTAMHGMVSVFIDNKGNIHTESYRRQRRHYSDLLVNTDWDGHDY